MDFGWKHKAERLRMVLLSSAHQIARELPSVLSRTLAIYGRVHKTGDATGLQEEMGRVDDDGAPKPLWEPVEIYGWKIEGTLYLQNGQLWWLLHAIRLNERQPRDKDIVLLDKVLEHLGADPQRDVIIGPRTGPADEPGLLPFGWWTWFNRQPLYEVQVNKSKKGRAMMRVVPLGARETEGYESVDMRDAREAKEPSQ